MALYPLDTAVIATFEGTLAGLVVVVERRKHKHGAVMVAGLGLESAVVFFDGQGPRWRARKVDARRCELLCYISSWAVDGQTMWWGSRVQVPPNRLFVSPTTPSLCTMSPTKRT